MVKTLWVYGLGALVAFGSAACGVAPPSEEVDKERAAISGLPDFLWWNRGTGEISTWLLSGPTVTGTLSLDGRCGQGDNCSNEWVPLGTDGNKIWWFDQFGTGEVAWWTADNTGHVTYGPALSWTCPPPSCSYYWSPAGIVHLSGQEGVLWHNTSTDQTGIWLLAADGVTVTAAPILSTRCGATEGCTSVFNTLPSTSIPTTFPRLTADFDGDGNSDILWWNEQTGTLTVWLLNDTNGTVTVKSKQTLSWTVRGGAGWTTVGAADVDGDGHADLLWQHYPDGEMSNWLLDGNGNAIGNPTLSWTCDANCGNAGWSPVGYVTF
jgi:hypothetical protein